MNTTEWETSHFVFGDLEGQGYQAIQRQGLNSILWCRWASIKEIVQVGTYVGAVVVSVVVVMGVPH